VPHSRFGGCGGVRVHPFLLPGFEPHTVHPISAVSLPTMLFGLLYHQD
jgi:hypothetical protein